MGVNLLILLFLTVVPLASWATEQERVSVRKFTWSYANKDCTLSQGFYMKPHDSTLVDEFLEVHAKFREQAGACGYITPEWNQTLADMAQSTAEACNIKHQNTQLGDKPLGQNIYIGYGKLKSPETVCSAWYNEVKGTGKKGHYRMIISGKVTQIGCARARCKSICNDQGQLKQAPRKKIGYTAIVCNYDHQMVSGEVKGCKCFNPDSDGFYKMDKGYCTECDKDNIQDIAECIKCDQQMTDCKTMDGTKIGTGCVDAWDKFCNEERTKSCTGMVRRVCRKSCGLC